MAGRRTVKEYIRYTILGLRLSGLYTEGTGIFSTRFYWIYTLVFNVFFVAGLNVCLVMYLLKSLGDIDVVVSSSYLTVTFVMPSIKTYYYLKNWSIIGRLMDRLDDDLLQPRNERQNRKGTHFFRYQNAIHVLYCCNATSMTILWACIPIFMGEERRLPFLSWLPYDWKRPVFYELTYIHQAISVACLLFININMDMITFGFNSYVSVECDFLTDTLRHIYQFSVENLEKKGLITEGIGEVERHQKVLEEMYGMLLHCIKHHKMIIEFAEDTDEAFNVLIFLQFGSSLFSLCLTMYELTVIKSFVELSVVVIFQFAIFLELFFYCFFGEEIITKSTDVASAAYDMAWTDTSELFKKSLNFLVVRAQRPIQMRALNFFILSLPTCATIYRISWSFFVMLHQTQNKQQNSQQ